MAYIGREPQIGNFQVCDAITVVDAQAAYTMQVGGVDVSPESANHMLVSLNGILQAPTTSFTVSGSTITFASALETGDVIDFIQILGNVLDLGVPSDDTVSTAKIVDANVTAAKMFSGFANGITEADNWRLTANTNSGTDGFVTANWERSDSNGYTKIGTGLSESSGVFSFATTGIYLITYHASFLTDGGDIQCVLSLNTTTDNSTYIDVCHAVGGNGSGTDGIRTSASSAFIFDVTNTTNCKFKFETESMSSTTALIGNTSHSFTSFTTVRLGNT
jgi:hypothetical protein